MSPYDEAWDTAQYVRSKFGRNYTYSIHFTDDKAYKLETLKSFCTSVKKVNGNSFHIVTDKEFWELYHSVLGNYGLEWIKTISTVQTRGF